VDLSEVVQPALVILSVPTGLVKAGYFVGISQQPRSAVATPSDCYHSAFLGRQQSSRRRGPTAEPGAVVLLEMSIEVGLLSEAAVAQSTAERTLSVVDVPHVALKVGRDAETAPTVFAPVWLFTRVCA